MVSSSLELHRYATARASRVVTALTLLKSHLFKCAREPSLPPPACQQALALHCPPAEQKLRQGAFHG